MAELDLTAFYGQFRDEAWENLNTLEQGLTALEARPDDTALLDSMLRAIHTTKGSAKIMGFVEINRLAHEIEEVLGAVRRGDVALTPEVGDTLLQASQGIRTLTLNRLEGQSDRPDVDGLVATMRRLLGQEEEPAPEAAPLVTVAEPGAARPRETMRVDMEHVDRLGRLVGETLALQQQALAERSALHDLELAQQETGRALEGLAQRLAAYQDRFRPLQAEDITRRLDLLTSALQKARQQQAAFARRHADLVERFSLTVDELRQQSQSLRMVPIGALFEVFTGVVRRLAGEGRIEVSLEIAGADVELDRRVLDLLREPLVHLVRNALAHGIEPPEERLGQHKPRRGRLRLEARQQGRRVRILVSDDGRGIDLERVRRVAVEKGLLDAERAAAANETALLELIFRPNFSTRRQADDMSGRGIGLDVVQSTMRRLNGLAQVRTQSGTGTTVTLDVPLTLATNRVLLVQADGATLAIPTTVIRGLARLHADDIVSVEGRPMLRWQDSIVPITTLAQSLGGTDEPTGNGSRPAVIAGENGQAVALVVERLLDEIEALVQPLGEILGDSPFFSSATLLENDQVVPILNLGGLLAGRPAGRAGANELLSPLVTPREPPRILLAEDAITTRELERSILEAAGYRVETAIDGLDALQKLGHGNFDLLITDIEMPRMDGFELTVRLRQDPRWADLPVLIISARGDEQNRQRGIQAGAQAYIVKSRFDQGNLLETIARLID